MISVGDLGALILTLLVALVLTSIFTLVGIAALRGLNRLTKRFWR